MTCPGCENDCFRCECPPAQNSPIVKKQRVTAISRLERVYRSQRMSEKPTTLRKCWNKINNLEQIVYGQNRIIKKLQNG